MSLVAYASSDEEGSESDDNSNEDVRPVVDVRPVSSVKENLGHSNKAKNEEPVDLPQDYDIQDEDDWGTVKSTKSKSIFSVLPPPSKKVDEFSIQEEDDISDLEKLKSGFQSKENAEKMIKDNAKSVVSNKDENIEDGKRTKKLILPKPKSSGDTSSKQTMKITLPDVRKHT